MLLSLTSSAAPMRMTLAVASGLMNKPLWIGCLLGAAMGITVGLVFFDSPFAGVALGLGLGALVGAAIGPRR